MPEGHVLILLFLFIHRMCLGHWVELSFLVLLTGVFFVLVIKSCVVHVSFPNAFSVAGTYHLDESIL